MNSNFRLKSLVLEISLSLFKWFNNGQPKCTEYKSQETNKRERRQNTHIQCARCRSENPSKGLEREMYAINLNRQLEKMGRKKKYGESQQVRELQPTSYSNIEIAFI